MERSKAGAALFLLARASWQRTWACDLEESSTGGGSDGNFTAALGIPTLDGMGAVGEGAHAAHESILIDRIADRVALLAKLNPSDTVVNPRYRIQHEQISHRLFSLRRTRRSRRDHGRQPVARKRPTMSMSYALTLRLAGKLDASNARFRDHTEAIFKRHDLKTIGYWVPEDNKDNLLIYIVDTRAKRTPTRTGPRSRPTTNGRRSSRVGNERPSDHQGSRPHLHGPARFL